jgi:segregation and condensation protein A
MQDLGTQAVAARGAGATCAVKLSLFEGPLDLLLHLIRENEMDVTELPVSEIADQYVAYLELMGELQLDVAAEYLVMAATLAWIKSRMLLPPSEEGDEDEGPDPRAELIARLMEYERFKDAAETLAEYTRLERDVFAARASEVRRAEESDREIEVTLVALLDAFRRVLSRAPKGPGLHEVESEAITVLERMEAIMQALAREGALEFERVFAIESPAPPSRALLVATFLALLELVRVSALRVYQSMREDGVPEGPIRLRGGDESAGWRTRVAEET